MSDEFGPASMGTSGASSRRIHWAAVVVSLIVGLGTGGIGGYFMARSHAKVAEASAQGAQTVRRVDGELSGTTSRVEVDLDYVKARREACVDAGAAAAAIAAIIARLQRAVSTSGGGEKQRPVRIDLSRWDDGMADYWSMSATFRRSMAAYRVFFDGFLGDAIPEQVLIKVDNSLSAIRASMSAQAWVTLGDQARVISTWTDELPKRCQGK